MYKEEEAITFYMYYFFVRKFLVLYVYQMQMDCLQIF